MRKREHGKRRGGFTLIELMVAVAIVGILAAIAIPSFMKYIAKAKTTEARGQLEKMYNAARVYYLEQFGARAIIVISPQFPESEGPNPLASCCAGGQQRCQPRQDLWTAPTWKALQFSMDDPHYYRYEFVRTTGTGPSGSGEEFTARALGDLDCDGLLSTFEMYGKSGDMGTDPTGASGVYRELEIE